MEYGSEINFLLKNDGEKWSIIFYFEIPPCRKPFSDPLIYVIKGRIFVQNDKFSNHLLPT